MGTRRWRPIETLAALIAATALSCGNQAEYRGHTLHYHLAEWSITSGYEIDDEEVPMVRSLILHAPMAAKYPDAEAYSDDFSSIVVPGCGSSFRGRRQDGIVFDCIEIPHTERDRCVMYWQSPTGETVTYYDVEARPLYRRKLPTKVPLVPTNG